MWVVEFGILLTSLYFALCFMGKCIIFIIGKNIFSIISTYSFTINICFWNLPIIKNAVKFVYWAAFELGGAKYHLHLSKESIFTHAIESPTHGRGGVVAHSAPGSCENCTWQSDNLLGSWKNGPDVLLPEFVCF